MKKIIAAGLMAGMAIGGLALGAGTANAYPPCQENWALDQATGKCAPIYSTQINGCDTSEGASIAANLKCWGDGWEGESPPSEGTGLDPRAPGRPPTITNPQGVRPVTMGDVYALICNDLDANGVSVASVENIFHILYGGQYQYAQRDAGRTVALAVQDTCPRYKSALVTAQHQALG